MFRALMLSLVIASTACGLPIGNRGEIATPVGVPATIAPPAAATSGPPVATPVAVRALRTEPYVSGLRSPIGAVHAGDGTGRLFVIEKAGTIRVVRAGQVEGEFLNITELVSSAESERGLLGIAFHPRFSTNRQFFLNYTDRRGNTVVARYLATSDRSRAEPASAKVILTIDQPFPNHNGGHLAFGPDGFLYIGTGDGGSGGDPRGNAQNLGSLLGKMLRIDIDRGDPYAIPSTNPFRERSGARPEIWASGLRNPWRYTFDRQTGDLYIGDVGQNAWEEVSFQPAGSTGGENYGWNRMEGRHCYPATSRCDQTGLVLPVAEYPNSESGCSVVGGYVYRGRSEPALTGTYLYADYCRGTIWGLIRLPDGSWRTQRLLEGGPAISSLAEDEAGELYTVGLSNGSIARIRVG